MMCMSVGVGVWVCVEGVWMHVIVWGVGMYYYRCVGLQYKISGVASHLILIGVWNWIYIILSIPSYTHSQVTPSSLDLDHAHIQITYVETYFTSEELQEWRTKFEREIKSASLSSRLPSPLMVEHMAKSHSSAWGRPFLPVRAVAIQCSGSIPFSAVVPFHSVEWFHSIQCSGSVLFSGFIRLLWIHLNCSQGYIPQTYRAAWAGFVECYS